MAAPETYGCGPIPYNRNTDLKWPELIDKRFARGAAVRRHAQQSTNPKVIADAKKLEQQCMTNGAIYGAKIGAKRYFDAVRVQHPDTYARIPHDKLPKRVMEASTPHAMRAYAQQHREQLQQAEIENYEYPISLDIFFDGYDDLFSSTPLEHLQHSTAGGRVYGKEMFYGSRLNGTPPEEATERNWDLVNFDEYQGESRASEILASNVRVASVPGQKKYKPSDSTYDYRCVGVTGDSLCETRHAFSDWGEKWYNKIVAPGYEFIVPEVARDLKGSIERVDKEGLSAFFLACR